MGTAANKGKKYPSFCSRNGDYRGKIHTEGATPGRRDEQKRIQETTNKILNDYSEYSKVIYTFINKEIEKGCRKEEAIKKVANNERVQLRLYSYQKWKEKMQQKIFSVEDIITNIYDNYNEKLEEENEEAIKK